MSSKFQKLHETLFSEKYEKAVSVFIILYGLCIIVLSYPDLRGTHISKVILVGFGAIFTLEYLLKLLSTLSTKSSFKWSKSFLGIIDLIAIGSFLLSFFVHYNFLFLRILRILKVLPVNQDSQIAKSLKILIEVLRKKRYDLIAIFLLLSVLLLVASCAVFCFEADAQPDKFRSIPDSLWWAIITMTTVGYGDLFPVTEGGRIVAGLFSVIGFGFIALPAAIISTGYVKMKSLEDI